MKFPLLFKRYTTGTNPTGGVVLGTDVLPIDTGGNPTKSISQDNILPSKATSINGWPIHRLIFAANYRGGGGATVAMPVACYTFEDQLGVWLPLTGSATTITPGTNAAPSAPIFFDTFSLIDSTNASSFQGPPSSGAPSFLFIVGTGTSPPVGEYDFAAATELTTKPF